MIRTKTKREDLTMAGEEAVQVKVRMAAALRTMLERLADQAGRSLSAEIVSRVAETVHTERALGGPEMRWLVNLAVSAFTFAARLRAPEDPDWTHNREAYKAGMFAVIDGMLAGLPDATPEEIHLEIEGLRSRLLTRCVQAQLAAGPEAGAALNAGAAELKSMQPAMERVVAETRRAAGQVDELTTSHRQKAG
jgi:hypothetical protein